MSASSSSEQGFPLFPAGMAAMGLLAVVLGRGLAHALPGTIVGYDAWVSLALTLGAFCAQFFAIVGATLAVRSALWLALQRPAPHNRSPHFWHTSVATAGKAGLGCCALFVCAVVFVAAQPRVVAFGPIALTLLSLSVAALLGVCASLALESRATRALSLIAVHGALACLIHTFARLTAYNASTEGHLLQYDFARVLSTCAQAAECLLLVLASVWLWRNGSTFARAATSVLVACAPAVAWSNADTGLRLALVRSLEQLCPHPDPFLPATLRLCIEFVIVALACGAVLNTKAPRSSRLVVCFTLLGRSSGDTPLGALLLLLASLSLLVQIALESTTVSPSSNDELRQPTTTSGVHV